MSEISTRKVKEMKTEGLEREFKVLAGMLSPINTRRSEVAKELKSRADQKDIDIKLKHFFPTMEDRKAAYRRLKQELG